MRATTNLTENTNKFLVGNLKVKLLSRLGVAVNSRALIRSKFAYFSGINSDGAFVMIAKWLTSGAHRLTSFFCGVILFDMSAVYANGTE
jgi:hypothetical protein